MELTAQQQGIVAFYRHDGKLYKVYDKVDDFQVIDDEKERWYSTHKALTLKADIQAALIKHTGHKIKQTDIEYLI